MYASKFAISHCVQTFRVVPGGNLHLLENQSPIQFSGIGVIAGINIPALVYVDLLGLPRPTAKPQAGIR